MHAGPAAAKYARGRRSYLAALWFSSGQGELPATCQCLLLQGVFDFGASSRIKNSNIYRKLLLKIRYSWQGQLTTFQEKVSGPLESVAQKAE